MLEVAQLSWCRPVRLLVPRVVHCRPDGTLTELADIVAEIPTDSPAPQQPTR